MVSIPPVHAQNMSNTLLEIKYHKQTNIALLHSSQFPIDRASHTLPVQGHVSCFIACAFQCIYLVQHHKRCAMWSPQQSHISAVQQFPHVALAHTLIQSQCPYCVHSCNKAILYIKVGLWRHHFVHIFIISASHAIHKNLFQFLSVVAFQFSSCTFIHQTPWHNCVTVLGHSKYDILVHCVKDPSTIDAHFNVPLPHLHRL